MTQGLVLGLCRNVYCRRSWILLLQVFNQIFLSYNTGRSPDRAKGPAGYGHSKITRVCVLNWPLPLLTSV